MEIAFSPGAWREWRRLPVAVQRRLKEKLLRYSRDPLAYGVKLTDQSIGQYRFRVGDYRIVFDLAGETLFVLAVGNRKEIYR
ncbi:MAG: type II toxin-antitoxin system RelE/ParE family toxin [Acidobacteria bacterium]|nr:type II toxin-antitoxin system RelE/ParE family toxin [Acidobacteriota bacterium]